MKRTTRMGRTRQMRRRQRKTRKKENCSRPPPVCCAWKRYGKRRRRPWPGEPGDPPPVSALREEDRRGEDVCASVLRCIVPHPYTPFTKRIFTRTVAGIPGNLTVVNLGRRFPRKERRKEPWEIHLGREGNICIIVCLKCGGLRVV